MSLSAADIRKQQLKIIDTEQITVTTAGTPVNPTSNTDAIAVRVINNNANKVVAVGKTAGQVDATTTPMKGFPLWQGDSKVYYVDDDASEVVIDADTNGTVATAEIYGRA